MLKLQMAQGWVSCADRWPLSTEFTPTLSLYLHAIGAFIHHLQRGLTVVPLNETQAGGTLRTGTHAEKGD